MRTDAQEPVWQIHPTPLLAVSQLVTAELRAAALFAVVVAGVVGAVGVGCHFAQLSFLQAHVVANGFEAAVAAVLPPLLAGFTLFLARRFAWQSTIHAAATAVACAGIGVVLHDNVLSSDLFYGQDLSLLELPLRWLRAAVSPAQWSGVSTASLMPVYATIVVVSGLASARLQYWAGGGRSVKRFVAC